MISTVVILTLIVAVVALGVSRTVRDRSDVRRRGQLLAAARDACARSATAMTAADAQRHLTRIHACGCQEFWFMKPPLAMRCALHEASKGPCDNTTPPEHLDEALEALALADREETARRATTE